MSFEIEGTELSVRLAGDREKPALLLIHGFPSSSKTFRNVIGPLARDWFVIAPDLPGFGGSDPVERPSFSRFADILDGLLARLGAASFHLYLHDYGAAVGLHLATRAPRRIRSLIVQNANAHESGMGAQWSATRAYWGDPTPQRQAEATAHLTLAGTRDQYVGGVPRDIAERIDPRLWEEDWRIMSLPGRLETQRALVLDYRSHVVRFAEIAEYLDRSQPPALMLWGRHDIFFDLGETLSWMKALPRMESHILDGPHFLLETHPAECAALTSDFIRRVEGAETAAETTQSNAEHGRADAEHGREAAERGRRHAEARREHGESARVLAEDDRATAETLREAAEALRQASEAAREAAVEQREVLREMRETLAAMRREGGAGGTGAR